eukprot:8743919-Pyramimonas_sp.AAC.1
MPCYINVAGETGGNNNGGHGGHRPSLTPSSLASESFPVAPGVGNYEEGYPLVRRTRVRRLPGLLWLVATITVRYEPRPLHTPLDANRETRFVKHE